MAEVATAVRRPRSVALAAVCTVLLALAGCSGGNQPEPSPSPSPSVALTLEDAVWEGTWEFDYTLTRLVGATPEETSAEPGQKIRRIWEVTPGCPDRPCNSQISATNPDDPEAGEVVSVVTYGGGVFRIEQEFPPEVTNACRAADGTIVPDAFQATNSVEVTPTAFEARGSRAVVTEVSATKQTAFIPKPEAEGAGGTCERKAAQWEATAVPVDG